MCFIAVLLLLPKSSRPSASILASTSTKNISEEFTIFDLLEIEIIT